MWRLGDDEALLDVVTSANVACGFHAGDPTTMRRVCAAAAERGVAIGAQVGYRDLAGFGRRRMDIAPDDLAADVLYQLGALEACARAAGTRGPLREAARRALQHRRRRPGPGRRGRRGGRRATTAALPLLGLPGSRAGRRRARGRAAVRRRGVRRPRPTAPTAGWCRAASRARVIEDPYEVVARAAAFALHQQVTAADGTVLRRRAALAVRARRHPGRGLPRHRDPAHARRRRRHARAVRRMRSAAATATRALLVEPDDPAAVLGAGRGGAARLAGVVEVVPGGAHRARRRSIDARSTAVRRRDWPRCAADRGCGADTAGGLGRAATSATTAPTWPTPPPSSGWTPDELVARHAGGDVRRRVLRLRARLRLPDRARPARCTCRAWPSRGRRCRPDRSASPASSPASTRGRRPAAGGCSAAPTRRCGTLDRDPAGAAHARHPRAVRHAT